MLDQATFVSEFNTLLKKKLVEFEASIETDDGKQLWGYITELVSQGGKRFRPYFAYLLYTGYGGSNKELIMSAGVALELFHAYILMHDDVIDSDTQRYHAPNVIGRYQAVYKTGSIPQGMGIVAGDIVHTFAYDIILGLAIPIETRLQCLRYFLKGNLDVNLGQQLDTLNIKENIEAYSLKKLEQINHYKSSSYSTMLPGSVGLLLAQGSQSDYKNLQLFAEPLGFLYQLVDDYSDYFTNQTGFNTKDKYRDYRQGKATYPLYLLYTQDSRHEIFRHFGDKKADSNYLKRVTEVLESAGAKSATEDLIREYADQARVGLSKIEVDPFTRSQLEKLIVDYEKV